MSEHLNKNSDSKDVLKGLIVDLKKDLAETEKTLGYLDEVGRDARAKVESLKSKISSIEGLVK